MKLSFNRRTILGRMASFLLVGAAAVAFQGAVVQTASAHGLTIVASSSCVNGTPVITFTATSWDLTDIAGSNTEIDIFAQGTKVAQGAFTLANNNTYTATVAAPTGTAGTDVVIEAAANGAWGDGFANGQTAFTDTIIANNCTTFGGCSVTQGGWGAPVRGNNPSSVLASHFTADFPLGVTIGGSPFSLRFTSAAAVRAFLPQGGTPGALTSSAVNPTTSAAGVFAGQVLALELNVTVYNLGAETLNGTGTSLDGSTVSQILAAANTALAGGALPSGFTYSSLNDLVTNLNQSFDGCVSNNWAMSHLH